MRGTLRIMSVLETQTPGGEFRHSCSGERGGRKGEGGGHTHTHTHTHTRTWLRVPMSRSMFMVTSVFSKLSSPTPCWRRLVGSGMKPWPHGLKGKVVPCRGQPNTKLNTTMKRNSCLSSRWLQSKQSIFRHFTFKAILLQDFHQPGYTNNVDTIYHPCALVQCKPRSHKPSSFSGIALNIRGSETSGLGLQVWTATLLLHAPGITTLSPSRT